MFVKTLLLKLDRQRTTALTAKRQTHGVFPGVCLAVLSCLQFIGLTGCATTASLPDSAGHLPANAAARPPVPLDYIIRPASIRGLATNTEASGLSRYSASVHDLDVREFLFALARDAKLNIDIHPGVSGRITMQIEEQTLPQIMQRLSEQLDIRYRLNQQGLRVRPDTAFLKNYRISYPNIQRDARSQVSTSTNLAASGSLGGSSGAAESSNSSTTTVSNRMENNFWARLTSNLQDLLRETDKILPQGSSETLTEQTGQQTAIAQTGTTAHSPLPATTRRSNLGHTTLPERLTQQESTRVSHSTVREAAMVISNAESGLISIRATQRQHARIRAYLDDLLANAHRQVLIEATIVEVDLSERYQQGIDWQILQNHGHQAGSGLRISPQGPITSGMQTGGLVSSLISFNWQRQGKRHDISAALRLLESFGDLRVLSSPKITVLNNQTSLLKVVDNEVYFMLTATPGSAATATSPAIEPIYQTTVHSVPIGLLMSVTPQINSQGSVILNLRPTISRISGYALDPNPILAKNGLSNPIPIIQTRELESVLRIQSGEVAVLGGLMQDNHNRRTDAVPGLSQLPALGEMFKYKDHQQRKSELVVFLRPSVVLPPLEESPETMPLADETERLDEQDFLTAAASAQHVDELLYKLLQQPINASTRQQALSLLNILETQAQSSSRPDNEHLPALAVLAGLLANTGALPTAQMLYQRLSRLEPEQADHAYNLALALDQQEDHAQAQAHYQRALQLAKQTPESAHFSTLAVQNRLHRLNATRPINEP